MKQTTTSTTLFFFFFNYYSIVYSVLTDGTLHTINSIGADTISNVENYVNYLRALHNSPPIYWNSSLAKVADIGAVWNARNKLRHHTNWQSENIYTLQGTNTSLINTIMKKYDIEGLFKMAITGFYNEVILYNYTNVQNANSHKWGHFTSMIWVGHSWFGMGIAVSSDYTFISIFMNLNAIANVFPVNAQTGAIDYSVMIANVLPLVSNPSTIGSKYPSIQAQYYLNLTSGSVYLNSDSVRNGIANEPSTASSLPVALLINQLSIVDYDLLGCLAESLFYIPSYIAGDGSFPPTTLNNTNYCPNTLACLPPRNTTTGQLIYSLDLVTSTQGFCSGNTTSNCYYYGLAVPCVGQSTVPSTLSTSMPTIVPLTTTTTSR